ncbi:transposase [Hydrobacter penzbergensis]|uniref:transposase n=1 Tax=Hydrobacter penzbergensis TaxID=1235997 RepID=UPI000B87FAF9
MYSTNLTDAQWGNIKDYLGRSGRKRKYSLRSIWDGLMYLLKTGCQWRMLPKEFPRGLVVMEKIECRFAVLFNLAGFTSYCIFCNN